MMNQYYSISTSNENYRGKPKLNKQFSSILIDFVFLNLNPNLSWTIQSANTFKVSLSLSRSRSIINCQRKKISSIALIFIKKFIIMIYIMISRKNMQNILRLFIKCFCQNDWSELYSHRKPDPYNNRVNF